MIEFSPVSRYRHEGHNTSSVRAVDNASIGGFRGAGSSRPSLQTGPSIPWYQPLVGSGLSLSSFRSSRVGRWVTHNTLRVLERLRVSPRGTVWVAETLNLCAAAMAEAGRLGIFTPMYLIHARKPAQGGPVFRKEPVGEGEEAPLPGGLHSR